MRAARILLVVGALCAGAGAPACGSSLVVLSHEEFDRLPRDARQEIFDAENDLVIALNRQDEAEDRKTSSEEARRVFEERWKRTQNRLSSTGKAGRIDGARKVHDANEAYLDLLVDVAGASITTARAGVVLARARLVLQRQRAAARIGRATLGSLRPLEERVADAEAKVKGAVAAEEGLRTRAVSQLDAWKTAEDAYARGSNDYDTGVWE
jgi:hypothetical protein